MDNFITGSGSDTSYIESYKNIDFKKHPELYPIGKGEQGVLVAQPYKDIILQIGWAFKTPAIAEESSCKILAQFYKYLDERDFVGADMCRKFLMMGWTRARRYANHAGGRKYAADKSVLPQKDDALTCDKAIAAQIFRQRYVVAKDDMRYLELKRRHKIIYEQAIKQRT